MNLTAQQVQALRAEFDVKLIAATAAFRARAVEQFLHNIQKNVPAGIVSAEDVVFNSLSRGHVAAIQTHVHWDCEQTVRLASRLLEDSNCHSENAALVAAAARNHISV